MSAVAAIDVHAHLAPPETLARLGWLRVADGEAAVRVGDRWQPVPRALVEPDTLLADGATRGIGVRVVSLPPFLLRHDLPAADGVAYSRAVNDGLAALARRTGGRLRVLATVPLQDPPAAVAETRRARGALGCDGVAIATSVAGRVELDDPALAPFWEVCERLDALVFIHPHEVAGAARMQRYHLRNLVGNPTETALGAAHLIFGGVLTRHPGLRVLLAHGGGALPWLLGRLDRGFAVRPECQRAGLPPSQQARRVFYDTLVFSPPALRALVEWVGATQVVLGTDAPFDMSDPHPVTTVAQALGDADARHAVLADNAARLLASARAVDPPPPSPSA